MEEQEGKDEGQSRNSSLTPDDAHRPRCALCGHCRAAATRFVLQRDEWIRGDVQHVRHGLLVVSRKESRWGRQHDMMQVQVVEIGGEVIVLPQGSVGDYGSCSASSGESYRRCPRTRALGGC